MADAPDATPAAAANDDTPGDAPGAPTPAVGAPEAESAPEAEGVPDGGGGAPLQLVIPDRSRSAAEELLGKAAAVIVPSTPKTPAEGEEHPTFEFVKVRADALPLPRTAARARASAAHECPCVPCGPAAFHSGRPTRFLGSPQAPVSAEPALGRPPTLSRPNP